MTGHLNRPETACLKAPDIQAKPPDIMATEVPVMSEKSLSESVSVPDRRADLVNALKLGSAVPHTPKSPINIVLG